MADDVTFQPTVATPPTGTKVATDDVGGVHYQRMKLVDGTDGSATAAKVSSEGNLQTITPNRTASGTLGALNDALTMSGDGLSFVAWSFDTATLVGTVTFEYTMNGTDWVTDANSWFGFQLVTSVVDPGASGDGYVWLQPVGKATSVRLRVSAYISGSTTARGAGTDSFTSEVPQYAAILALGATGYSSVPSGSGEQTLALRVTEATNSPISTSLGVMDDWDEADRAKVNPIAGQAGVQGGAGASSANTQRVAIATDANAVSATLAAGTANIGDVDVVTLPKSATATLTNVSDTATSTTLLAANAARLGASIHNDSTAILYVKFGTTASTTSFTVKMVADAHYEIPFGYTGRIDGIWASDASGAARITELT